MKITPFAAFAVALCCAALTASCAKPRASHADAVAPTKLTDSVEMLASWMAGAYSSNEQSLADPSYVDIHLHMAPIWTDRADGPWLYIEQARADMPGKPYRQRVYRLSSSPEGKGAEGGEQSRGVYSSSIYALPEPVSRFTGAWNDPARAAFKNVGPGDLRMLDGCTVVLRWNADQRAFVGGTEGVGCASTRDGAKYTTSEITFTKGLLTSWDRGFDESGKQVWGAVNGGYRFVKQ